MVGQMVAWHILSTKGYMRSLLPAYIARSRRHCRRKVWQATTMHRLLQHGECKAQPVLSLPLLRQIKPAAETALPKPLRQTFIPMHH